MIEVKPTKVARNTVIVAAVIAAIVTVAKMAARNGLQPWVIALGAAVLVIGIAGAFLYADRMRVRVVNGELEYRPVIGPTRRLPIASIDRVIYAPTITQRWATDQARFVIVGIDRKVFMRLNPTQWDATDFTALTGVFRNKLETVTATTVADIRTHAPLVLTYGELHPVRMIWRTVLIAAVVIFAILGVVFAVGYVS
jgi:hypothetical protein